MSSAKRKIKLKKKRWKKNWRDGRMGPPPGGRRRVRQRCASRQPR